MKPHRAGILAATSIRVAFIATAVVAAVMLCAALITDVVSSNNAISSIDGRLQARLTYIAEVTQHNGSAPPREPDSEERALSLPLAFWLVGADGSVEAATPNAPDLPSSARHTSGPTNIELGGVTFRIAGEAVGGGWVVIGQSRAVVDQDAGRLIETELVVMPGICIFVFLGALIVGRQVARPVEAARQRQLAFTADASHELRTPVTVIEAETALALGTPREAEEYRSALERIGHEGGRLRHIVDGLLWLARFDATPAPPGAEPMDVAALVLAATERFAPVAERRHVRLTASTDGEGSMRVVAPPEWLDRLLGALLDNACRYAPEGGAVHVRASAVASHVLLAVEDNGPGIEPEIRTRIFDRFHRGVDGEEGAGLGLAIADAIVRSTHGTWSLGESSLGGASFMVTWPAV